MDEKTLILERLKQLGISAWCERGKVVIISNEDRNKSYEKNINSLNNQPVSR